MEVVTDEEDERDTSMASGSVKSGVQTESASDPKEDTRTGRIGTSGRNDLACVLKPVGVLGALLVSVVRRRHTS